MRKFAVVTMRDMGVGKKTLELRVQEEAGFLAEEFLSNEKKAFRPDNYLRKAVSNIICGVTFGHRLAINSSEISFFFFAAFMSLNDFKPRLNH